MDEADSEVGKEVDGRKDADVNTSDELSKTGYEHPTDSKKKGVSFSEHPPPGVSSSDDENIPSYDPRNQGYSEDSSSEDEDEYRRRMEKRKARSRERRASKLGSMKLSDPKKLSHGQGEECESSESEADTTDSRDKSSGKKIKESSGGSDSAESWEGVHDQYRKKKKGEKKFRFKDRHRRRSLHKRKLKFEELLTKESFRRPSMSYDQVKLFAKGRKDASCQKILDDDPIDQRDPFDTGRALTDPKPSMKQSPYGGNVDMVGGKALLKAALKFPVGSTTTSRMSFHTPEGKRQDLFNRSPSLWDLSMDEISRRMSEKSDLSSLDSFTSSPSRMSLLSKIGKIRRPSSLNRSPSQDSTGSATTVQSSLKRRKASVRNKPKRTKVTTLTFSLSGDAPTPAEKSARVDVGKAEKKSVRESKSKPLKPRPIRKKLTLPTITTTSLVFSSREYTLEKDNAYRSRPEHKRVILALQADRCASQPFRSFLLTTDNAELVFYLGFWQDVEKTRQDFQFGEMSFNSFLQSLHGIVTQYLLHSSPCRIEAPELLREEAIMNCLSPEIQEMPWQIRKLQKEVMEDLKFAHEAFCQQEAQSFLIAAAFKKDETRRNSTNSTGGSLLPPINGNNRDQGAGDDDGLETEMVSRMFRSLRYIIEVNLPDGRDPSPDTEISDDSDDDGLTVVPPPTYVRVPSPDFKKLASRSVKQYPDPENPTGIKMALKIPFDRRLQSATLYHPLKRGGQFMKRPMIRPKNFQDVLKDAVHFQFFKRYLKAHRSDVPLSFWNAVEKLRAAEKMKSRQTKARAIIKKYFHNPHMPATKLLHCNADIIKEIPYLDVVTTSMLFTAQAIVGRVLEERWFRRYAETFEERVDPSSSDVCDKSFNTRSLLSRNRRLKRIWSVFSDFIKRAASFLRSMRKPHLFDMFEKFLQREVSNNEEQLRRPESGLPIELLANPSESTILPFVFYSNEERSDGVKQRIINGQLVTFNFLANDLHFWRDIECYKNMAQGSCFTETTSQSLEEEANTLRIKANLIVTCYLESDILPKIRVNVPVEVADITVESLQNGLLDQALFHEATIYIFPLLLHFWKKFCAEHYRYVPTLSKKHRMIYGLKMTPVIAEQMRNKKKVTDTSQGLVGDVKSARPKKKPNRIDTADLPNYLDMDSSKFVKRRGSPVGFDEMGPRLTFSIRKGVTLIQPVRRKRFPAPKPIRELLASSERSRPVSPPRLKKPPIDIPLPKRSSRRTGLLDASLLQSFADTAVVVSNEGD